MRRRICCLGHLERMENSYLPKCLLVCRPASGKRSVGGQKRRWNDLVISDLQKCKMLVKRGGTGESCLERCTKDDDRKPESAGILREGKEG